MLPFDKAESLAVNEARLDHLASLGLDLDRKSVLEVGAGIGQLTGFFEIRGCRVCSIEGREENVRENLWRYRWRRMGPCLNGTEVYMMDLNFLLSRTSLPLTDIVFCYGFLYHTASPSDILANLSKKCMGLFLLETCVNCADDSLVKYVNESAAEADQSLDGLGCRPARDWIMAELRKHFEHVYLTKTQPRHDDFPLEWPSMNVGNTRAVFVASRHTLDLPTLTTELLTKQVRC